MADAVTGKPTPSTRARRKRREETERAFRMAAAPLIRRLPVPLAQATLFLADVFDWLNYMWNWNHDAPLDQSASAGQHNPTLDL